MSHVKVPPLALVVILALSCSVSGGKSSDGRSYVAGRYFLTLDGVKVGSLKTVQGGDAHAEVVNEAVGPDSFVMKHLGQVEYEDFEVQVGLNMGKPVYEWIRQSWSQKYARKDGSITATDFNYQPQSEQQFFKALLTETTIPTADAASKDAGYLTLKFSPEYTRPGKPGGKGDAGAAAKDQQQKIFLPSNFKLDIAGLNCKGVSRIESFTVKQSKMMSAMPAASRRSRANWSFRTSRSRSRRRGPKRGWPGARISSSRATTPRTKRRAVRSRSLRRT
jgi:hypothetical protein